MSEDSEALCHKIFAIIEEAEQPISAKDIARRLPSTITKKEVNQVLYQDKRLVRASGCPPLWSLPATQQDSGSGDDDGVPIVMIDLGNVHDTLEPLEPYAKRGLVRAYAFADLQFNGYGVNPRCDPSIAVYQSKVADKNAADIRMVWDCADIVLTKNPSGTPLTFFIVTKDQGFRSLGTILEDYGHTIHFLRNWDDLKLHVE